MITGLYAAFFAIFQMVMIPWIVTARARETVSLGDGESDLLARKTRAYGSFVETVPAVLFLMLIAELSGGPLWSLHALGAVMIVSRLSHAYGMMIGSGINRFCEIGTILTMAACLAGAALCVVLALKVL